MPLWQWLSILFLNTEAPIIVALAAASARTEIPRSCLLLDQG
jgi:hypothetical protein